MRGARRDGEGETIPMIGSDMDVSATPATVQGTQGTLWRDLTLCAGLLLALSLASLMLGTVALEPKRVLAALLSPASDPTAAAIVRNLRLPRLLLAALAGAFGGVAAVLLGGFTGVSARDPGWSGVLSLGALAAVGLLVAVPTSPWWLLDLAVVVGCGLGVALLTAAHRRWPAHARRITLLGLAIALGAPALALVPLIGELRLATWLRWCLGSLEQRDWTSWGQAWHAALVALVLVLAHLVWPQRGALRWAGAVLAATAATLAAGAVGLVGLLAGRWAAHASDKAGVQLALAGLVGATLLLGLDLAARGLTPLLPSLGLVGELPVGALAVVLSLLVVLLRWQRGRRAAKGSS